MSSKLSIFKTTFGYNKAKPITDECLRFIFDFRNIAIACRLKKFYKNIQWWFSAFFPPGKVWKVDSFVDTVVLF